MISGRDGESQIQSVIILRAERSGRGMEGPPQNSYSPITHLALPDDAIDSLQSSAHLRESRVTPDKVLSGDLIRVAHFSLPVI